MCGGELGGVWVQDRHWVSQKEVVANSLQTHLKNSPQKLCLTPPPPHTPLLPREFQRAHFCLCQSPLGSFTKALAQFMDGTPSLIFSSHKQPDPLATKTSWWITMKSRTLKSNYHIHFIQSEKPLRWSSGTIFVCPRLTFFLSPPVTIYAARICLTRFYPRYLWGCLWVSIILLFVWPISWGVAVMFKMYNITFTDAVVPLIFRPVSMQKQAQQPMFCAWNCIWPC